MAIDKAIEALEGSIKLIGRKVISNVMPKEQEANYEALQALRDMQEVDVAKAKEEYEARINGALFSGNKRQYEEAKTKLESIELIAKDYHLIRKE